MAQAGVLTIIALCVLCAAPAQASRLYVSAPDLGWESLEPYLQANLVVTINGGELDVRLCTEAQDRTVVVPFNDALGEYAKLVLFEAVLGSDAVSGAIAETVARYRAALPAMPIEARTSLREDFWSSLSRDSRFTDKVRRVIDKARKAGRIRCRPCEDGLRPTFLTLH